MNYFELFNLPVSFLPDVKEVRRRYIELSKEYHPDYFAQGDAAQQVTAVETSARINKALKIFSHKEATIRYVLMLKGLLEEEKYNLPPGFLMDMMELNEQVDDVAADDSATKNRIKDQVQNIEKELYAAVASIIENYQDGITSEAALEQVKAYYFKKKYLARIYEALEGKL